MNHIPYAPRWSCPKCGSESFRQTYEINTFTSEWGQTLPVEPKDERLRLRCEWCGYNDVTMMVKS